MFNLLKYLKRKKETKIRQQKQEREQSAQYKLMELRELFLAVEEFLAADDSLPRSVRKRFWDTFRKNRHFRKDVFDVLIQNEGVEIALKGLVKEASCQEQK